MASSLLRLTLLLTIVAGLTFSITALPTRAQTPAPLDPSAFELHEMGRIEGGIHKMAGDGNLLAAVSGRKVMFYDLSDITRPRTLSIIALPANSTAVQIDGEFAYVAWGNCSEAGACSGGFDVYDLALPTAPTRVAQMLTPTEVWSDLTLVGPTIYAESQENATIYTIDVSIPNAPVVRTTFDHFNLASAAFVVRADLGGKQFGYFMVQNELSIYDVETDQEVKRIDFPETRTFITSIAAVDLADDRHMLYLSDRHQGLRVIDLTDPAAPIVHPTIELANPYQIVAGSGALYVATGDWPSTLQLYVLDLANPLTPTISEPIPEREPLLLLPAANHLISVDASDAITLLDLSEPLQPQPISAIPLTTDIGYAYTNGYVLTYNTPRGLRALDISRPTAPQVHPSGLGANYGAPATLAASGNTAILGTPSAGWQLLDVADPTNVRLIEQSAFPINLIPRSLAIKSSQNERIAYLVSVCDQLLKPCSGPPQLHLVDITDVNQLVTRTSLTLPPGGIPTAVTVQADYLYLVSAEPAANPTTPANGRLQIFDVRDPADISLVSELFFAGNPRQVVALANLVYIPALQGGMHTIDVSNPAAPQLLSSFRADLQMRATAVAVDGPIVYVSTLDDAELFTLDMRDPTQPRLVDEQIIPGGSAALTIVGDQLIASGNGMTIYRRGPMPPGAVVDLRGAPMTDVSVTMSAGARSSLAAATPSRATDVNGRFSVQGAATGTQLTPSFGEAAFWPATRTIAQQPDALRFTMLPPPVTAEVSADTTTTLTLTDTQGLPTTLTAPAGSLRGASAVTLTGAAPARIDDLELAGQAFELRLAGADAQFAAPATVRVPYSRGDVRLISDRTQLALYRQTSSGWALAETGCTDAPAQQHDPAERTLTAAVCSPGVYALLGPTERVYLPTLAR